MTSDEHRLERSCLHSNLWPTLHQMFPCSLKPLILPFLEREEEDWRVNISFSLFVFLEIHDWLDWTHDDEYEWINGWMIIKMKDKMKNKMGFDLIVISKMNKESNGMMWFNKMEIVEEGKLTDTLEMTDLKRHDLNHVYHVSWIMLNILEIFWLLLESRKEYDSNKIEQLCFLCNFLLVIWIKGCFWVESYHLFFEKYEKKLKMSECLLNFILMKWYV